MANNELSGPLAATFLARRIAAWPHRRLTYRFVFAPETIGAISYLALRGEHLQAPRLRRLRRHLCRARPAVHLPAFPAAATRWRTARRSTRLRGVGRGIRKRGTSIRRAATNGNTARRDSICPVGSLLRGPYAEYPEYHTSLDNKDLISFEALARIGRSCWRAVCRVLGRRTRRTAISRHSASPIWVREVSTPVSAASAPTWITAARAHATLWLRKPVPTAAAICSRSPSASGMPIGLLREIAADCLEKDLFEEISNGARRVTTKSSSPPWADPGSLNLVNSLRLFDPEAPDRKVVGTHFDPYELAEVGPPAPLHGATGTRRKSLYRRSSSG